MNESHLKSSSVTLVLLQIFIVSVNAALDGRLVLFLTVLKQVFPALLPSLECLALRLSKELCVAITSSWQRAVLNPLAQVVAITVLPILHVLLFVGFRAFAIRSFVLVLDNQFPSLAKDSAITRRNWFRHTNDCEAVGINPNHGIVGDEAIQVDPAPFPEGVSVQPPLIVGL